MQKLLITTSILSVIFFMSCEKEEQKTSKENNQKVINSELAITIKSDTTVSFEKSNQLWKQLKKDNGNSYVYQVGFSSWTGAGSTTEITIKNDTVVTRKFESYADITNKSNIETSYIETQNELNNHQSGAKAITIEEMYNLCLSDYLSVDLNQNTISFDVSNTGLLKDCSYIPNNCIDDCSQGIKITAFEWLK